MFDTIRCNYTVYLPIELFKRLEQDENLQVTINEMYDRSTGEISYSAEILKHGIHFIRYYSNACRLIFETSIPKYLYGNNVYLIREKDLPLFYEKLKNDFKTLLNIDLDLDFVTITGLHVCYNFNVEGTGYSVTEWLKYISKQEIPYKLEKQVNMYKGKISGVIFKSNPYSKHRITFYDKQGEMNKKARNRELGRNLLRVEIKTSKHERKKFGNRISQLLKKDFFMYLMGKYRIEEILQNNQANQEIDQIPYVYLIDEKNYKIYQIEKLAGHLKIVSDLDDLAKSLYGEKTYDNRQKELKQLQQLIKECPVKKNLKVEI